MSEILLGHGERGTGERLLDQKLARVKGILSGFSRVVVAFSGGVDSTLLAKLACDVLGRANVLAAVADSPSMAREDLEEAKRLARGLGLRCLVVATSEVSDPSYRANTPARCFFCKQELFDVLGRLAGSRGYSAVLYGAIGDDRLSERPGQRAAAAAGVRAPLQEAGLAKREVRALAKQLGMPNWNRPQNACLSSRIPHGSAVTELKLGQIEEAEAALRAHGFQQVRVRHLGTHARIEVGTDEVRRFLDGTLCAEVARRFKALGFETVGVDRAGYRTGGADRSSADEILLTSADIRYQPQTTIADI
jgi:uncharacterized protein